MKEKCRRLEGNQKNERKKQEIWVSFYWGEQPGKSFNAFTSQTSREGPDKLRRNSMARPNGKPQLSSMERQLRPDYANPIMPREACAPVIFLLV